MFPHRLSAALALAFAEIPAEEREQMKADETHSEPGQSVGDLARLQAQLQEHRTSNADGINEIMLSRMLGAAPLNTDLVPKTKPRSKRGQRGRKWK